MAEASIMQEEDENSMLQSLFEVCREGTSVDVEEFLSTCPDLDINSADERGETALHVTAATGRLDTLILLLNKGANINAVTESGDAVVHFASKFGRLDVMKYLAEQHVDLNARNQQYDTPLHYAASRAHEDVLNFLCQAGGDYNAQNVRGSTPLHLSCEQCDIPTSLRLVHFACRTDLMDQMEETALHIACREDLQPVVQTMCAYGCPVDMYNRAGLTPLHIAAKTGNTDIIRCLLLSGADIDKPNKDGVRSEDIALAQGNSEAAELLNKVSYSITLDKRDSYIKQLLPATKPLPSIKVKVFGSSGVGKTTLIESLKAGFIRGLISKAFASKRAPSIDEKRDGNGVTARAHKMPAPHVGYTKGIDIQQVNISEAGDLSIWEFSGYEPYYLIYDQFLGEPNCIHVIVINMKEPEEERYKQARFWLNFLRGRMAPNEPIGFAGSQLVSSRVVLVATHAADAQCDRNSKGFYTDSSKASLINRLLAEFGSDLLIAPNIFLLDANQPSSPEMKNLRATLATLKSFILQYLEPRLGLLDATVSILPQWIKILSDFPVVTWLQFTDYIRSKVNILATEEHIRELTKQLQLIGEIISIKTDNDDDDMIVLSPQWLCTEVIGNFLSHEHVMKAPENGILALEYIHSVYPNCELNEIVKLLESLEVMTHCTSSGHVEFDAPLLNIVDKPKNLWQEEDSEMGSDPEGSVWGGVQISAAVGMHEQIVYVFPRLQVYLRRRLRDKARFTVQNWQMATKIRSGSLSAVIELQFENFVLELKCRGPLDQRGVMFFFQEELCESIFSLINDCCPGMYLDRQPLSPLGLKTRRAPCPSYESRTILLAQIDGHTSVQIPSPPGDRPHPTEQLVDLFAFGSHEIFGHMKPGMDLHISNLSLYARYVLSSQLDPSNPLGRDWCMLAILLGLTDLLPKVDVNEAAALSKADAILALYSRNPDATFRTLYEKLLVLDRSEAVDAILALTPLYRYIAPAGSKDRIIQQADTDRRQSQSTNNDRRQSQSVNTDRRQSQSVNADRRQSQSANSDSRQIQSQSPTGQIASPKSPPKSPKAQFAIPYASNGEDTSGDYHIDSNNGGGKSMQPVDLNVLSEANVDQPDIVYTNPTLTQVNDTPRATKSTDNQQTSDGHLETTEKAKKASQQPDSSDLQKNLQKAQDITEKGRDSVSPSGIKVKSELPLDATQDPATPNKSNSPFQASSSRELLDTRLSSSNPVHMIDILDVENDENNSSLTPRSVASDSTDESTSRAESNSNNFYEKQEDERVEKEKEQDEISGNTGSDTDEDRRPELK